MRLPSSIIPPARLRSSMPSSVRVIFRLPRIIRGLPSSSSSSIICRERVGWVRCRDWAAAVRVSLVEDFRITAMSSMPSRSAVADRQ